ncbi:MAG: alpha/beta hydrolase, partial [Verrucomicrobia bacterium]|nr:alpha/beta hydrolase [Verrucomicrobiota bacterium]
TTSPFSNATTSLSPVRRRTRGRRGKGAESLSSDSRATCSRPWAAKGIPHVTGVCTGRGETVFADLIVDATGRGSKLPDWLLRELLRGNGDVERYIADLSRPGALTASLNWYCANLAPRLPGAPPALPPVEAPTLGIWSTHDHYLDGQRLKASGRFVNGPWRYEQIDGASHWIPLDASDRLNQLLIEWLG